MAGIVGSTAYGLAGPGSDVDRLGMFAVRTETLHGLHPPTESVVAVNPDRTLHEVRKYARLALGGNPTVSELMWLDALRRESDITVPTVIPAHDGRRVVTVDHDGAEAEPQGIADREPRHDWIRRMTRAVKRA